MMANILHRLERIELLLKRLATLLMVEELPQVPPSPSDHGKISNKDVLKRAKKRKGVRSG